MLFSSCTGKTQDSKPTGEPGVIIAEFDGFEITEQEFRDRFYPEGNFNFGENGYALKLELTNILINEHIIKKSAESEGIEINPEEIEERFKSQFYQSPPTDTENNTRLKEGIRDQLIIEKFIKTKFGDFEIPESELKEYYNDNSGEFYETDEFGVYQIFVSSKAIADRILVKLKKGEGFLNLAEQFNVPPHREEATKVQVYKKGELPPEFEAKIVKLGKNRYTQVIKSSYGYHIFKLKYKKKAHVITFENARDQIRQQLTELKIEEDFNRWLRNERAKYEIKINQKFLEK